MTRVFQQSKRFMLRIAVFLQLLAVAAASGGAEPFVIEVVDPATGRGIPLVELRTTASSTYYTDSNGLVAFDEPEWMNRRVFFYVESPGYEMPQDGFGIRGRSLVTTPGKSGRIELPRTNIAERLYRVTGAGIYRDTIAANRRAPIRNPLLNGGVTGSDSVVNAVYRGRIHWFWGDTLRQSTPFGNFHVPGATSLLPEDGGLDPSVGVDLTYYVNEEASHTDEGGATRIPFAKETAHMHGDGPTWIGGLVVLKNDAGEEELFASYMKIEPPLKVYRRGVCRWNDEKEVFEHVADIPLDQARFHFGHPLIVHQRDGDYVYFPDPWPLVRVPARAKDLLDANAYECFSPLAASSQVTPREIGDSTLERNPEGQLKYGWRRNTSTLPQRQQGAFIKAGKMKPSEALVQLRDVESGDEVFSGGGSVYWNEYRQRYVSVFVQIYGESMLGEVWYSEAASPLGPWAYAVRIASHGNYSFYNPKQHPMFDQQAGRIIYFEGTYTHQFSGNPRQTPWYDYNQLMYRLDLSDPRLALPMPVYRQHDGAVSFAAPHVSDSELPHTWSRAPWFALDRQVPHAVGISVAASGEWETGRSNAPMFYGWPADSDAPGTTVLLYEYVAPDGKRHYDIEGAEVPAGFERAEMPLCRVWRSPWRRDERDGD